MRLKLFDTEKLRIRSDGDVVIGTNDLESNLGSRRRLAVCDTTNGALLHIRGLSPAIYFDQSGGGTGKIYLDNVGLEVYGNTCVTRNNYLILIRMDIDLSAHNLMFCFVKTELQ